jgi:hypothetical protein
MKTHTITIDDIFESNDESIEFSRVLSSSSGREDKELRMIATLAGFVDGEITGAHVSFSIRNNLTMLATTNINQAIEFYNTGKAPQ